MTKHYSNELFCCCQENPALFLHPAEYTGLDCFLGGEHMYQNEKQVLDLDDLIFEENDGGPSDR